MAQLDPVGVQVGHRINQTHLGLEVHSRHGCHRDSHWEAAASGSLWRSQGAQSLSGRGEQHCGQSVTVPCSHPSDNILAAEAAVEQACPPGLAQLLSCEQLCLSALFTGPSKMGIRSWSSAAAQDTFPPKPGGGSKGQTWVPAAAGVEHLW